MKHGYRPQRTPEPVMIEVVIDFEVGLSGDVQPCNAMAVVTDGPSLKVVRKHCEVNPGVHGRWKELWWHTKFWHPSVGNCDAKGLRVQYDVRAVLADGTILRLPKLTEPWAILADN